MRSSNITQDTIEQWHSHGEHALQREQASELELYQNKRRELNKEDLPWLEQAIEQRYLVMPKPKSQRGTRLREAYELWCMAKGLPTLIILPTSLEHIVQIEFDLEAMEPHGHWNLYQPSLLLKDERFRLMMLLCHEYSYSDRNVTLRQVNKDQAKNVVRELLALFDRSYQAHATIVETFLKKNTQA